MALRWNRATEWLVGLLCLSACAFAFVTTVLKKEKSETTYPYRFTLFYSQVDGIREGTDVRVLGVKKGYVANIEGVPASEVPDKRFLDPKKERAIALTIAMQEPLTLWDTYKVEFQTLTVFSNRVININPGLSSGETPYFSPTRTKGERISDSLPSAEYIDDFFKASSGVMEENREDLRAITSNLSSISSKLNGTKGTIPNWIGSTEAYDNLKETVSDAENIGVEGRRYMESSRKLENTFPIPFVIGASFYGRTTLIGRRIGPQSE